MNTEHFAMNNGLWVNVRGDIFLIDSCIDPIIGSPVLVMDTSDVRAHVIPFSSDIPSDLIMGVVSYQADLLIEPFS